MKQNNETITIEECAIQQEETIVKDNKVINININTLIQSLLYILGTVLLIMSALKYNTDLETYFDEYHFNEISYVGGDAYNYIISTARSTTIMVKSLILALYGCTSIIAGLILRISNK